MARETILVVEDEKDILNIIAFNLEREGYTVVGASTGETALPLARKHRPNLVVLDLMLPGMDGFEVCRKLRQDPNLRVIPVLMLTAKGEDADVVAGLEIGADDYVTKPFSPRILVARIRAVLRRAEGTEQPAEKMLRVNDLEIDVDRHEVRCCGKEIELSATEFSLLEFLTRHVGLVFSRERIISAVKGEDYPVTERSVDVQVLGLRRKLGACADMLVTVRGVGYKIEEE